MDMTKIESAQWKVESAKWALKGMVDGDRDVDKEDLNCVLVLVSDAERELKEGIQAK